MLKLVDPEERYLKEYKEAYLLSIKEIEKGNIKEHDMMFYNPDEVDVIRVILDSRDEENLPENYVPSYNYFLVDDGKFLGIINIRIRLTPSLLKFGGHIGYGTNPKYWKQGYGKLILKMGLEKARDLILEDDILITCDDDNIASSKVIEANGGVLENKVTNELDGKKVLTRRYWIKK